MDIFKIFVLLLLLLLFLIFLGMRCNAWSMPYIGG